MAIVRKFQIIRSEWPNADGEYYWTITDGVQEKGEFRTKEEAEKNIELVMLNWQADS